MADFDETLLQDLKENVSSQKAVLKDIAHQVVDNNVSNYPIFVATLNHVEIGRPLIIGSNNDSKWNINISTLEELVTKKLFFEGRVNAFRKIFKNPEQFGCFFVIEEKRAEFVFIPY